MLKNAYLDAKIGFDTAENEPSKVRGFLIGVWGVMILLAGCAANLVCTFHLGKHSWQRCSHTSWSSFGINIAFCARSCYKE